MSQTAEVICLRGAQDGGIQDVQDPWSEARIGLEPSKEKRW